MSVIVDTEKQYAWHYLENKLVSEMTTEPTAHRFFIQKFCPQPFVERRLLLFKPVVGVLTETNIEELHAVECPNCPWDGRTIFPGVELPEFSWGLHGSLV